MRFRLLLRPVQISFLLLIAAVMTGCPGGGGNGSNAAGGGSVSGFSGVYTSVEDDDLSMEFKSGGIVVFTAGDLGSSDGTFTVDGEKVLVTVNGVEHTMIRDGDCIEDRLHVFGKLCKGGKAGASSNISTRNVPTAPSGIYIAKNEDGEFKIEFKPGNTFTFTATPAGGGRPEVADATFIAEGDTIHATLPQGVPMVLNFVNNTYESTSFGLPMTFHKQ
jgi:hypothetical protein